MLGEKDKLLIFQLAENLTGCAQAGDTRQESLVNNVERRMRDLKITTLSEYLRLADHDPVEVAHLISALTIHTTSWFREHPHFVMFQEILLGALDTKETFKVWCAASSTGEEVYSFALMLEEFRRVHAGFEYQVLGTDIDPLSVAFAQRAIYGEKQMNFHLRRYKHHLLLGSAKTQGYFTLAKEIRERCTFRVHDLRSNKTLQEGPFHVGVCRNALIYFARPEAEKVVRNVLGNVKPDGYLFVGHSETLDAAEFEMIQKGHSVYCKRKEDRRLGSRRASKYKILSVDDSASTRTLLKKMFTDMRFDSHVVPSAAEASAFLKTNKVDLITLDLNMPDVSGDAWLTAERKGGLTTPVVILSDVHAADAEAVIHLLARGAQEYMEKSQLAGEPDRLKEIFLQLIRGQIVKADRTAVPAKQSRAFPRQSPKLVLIGASTGGPQALVKLLEHAPANSPPILITQHISPKFARPLAERLAKVSGLELGNVENGTPLLPGHLYLPLDDRHLGVEEKEGRLFIRTSDSHPVNGHRPSVDVMFNSALGVSSPVMAILLTGMGRDGAAGLSHLHLEGMFCIAQSEEDCVVYGMPREAIERQATDFVGNLDEIRKLMFESFQAPASSRISAKAS